MPSRKSGKGRKSLPEVRERVGSPSQRSRTGRDSLQASREGLRGPQVVRYGLGGPPAGPGGVEMPSQMAGRGQEALPEVWETLP